MSNTTTTTKTTNLKPKAEEIVNQIFQPARIGLAFTGRLKVGKDFCATAINAEIHGFADPLYALCRHFFGTADKDQPGMRATMQTLGQWGRNVINQSYPVSPARGLVAAMIRAHGEKMAPGFLVEWSKFGIDENIWLDALFRRVEKSTAPVVALVNVRFKNEYERCQAERMTLVHVMCSQQTYLKRLQKAGMASDDPALRDYSEQLALAIDAQVGNICAREPAGDKLLVVWNDPEVPAPSKRFLTLSEFIERFKQ